MNALYKISSSFDSIVNFFISLFNGLVSIVTFVGDGINFVIYSFKTIFSLFTSIF